MGCAFGKATQAAKGTLDQCITSCHSADNTCAWTVGKLAGNNCGSCPKGCDASDGVGECLTGCRIAFGHPVPSDGPNVWVTDIASADDPLLAAHGIGGLMSVEPHARYMRARWPNPRTGTQEIRPVANVQPLQVRVGRPPLICVCVCVRVCARVNVCA